MTTSYEDGCLSAMAVALPTELQPITRKLGLEPKTDCVDNHHSIGCQTLVGTIGFEPIHA